MSGTNINLPGVSLSASALTVASMQVTDLTTAGTVTTDGSGNLSSVLTENTLLAAAGSISVNSQKITDLATPTLSTDAATKAYVDSVAAGDVATSYTIAKTVTPAFFKQAAQTTDTACFDLTLSSQAPAAGATGTNRNPGNLILSVPAKTAGGAAGKISLSVDGSEIASFSASLGAGVLHASSGQVVTSSTIVDADVNAAAAIAGTKISPSFGAQALVSTSTLSLGTNPAAAGTIRLASGSTIARRNAGNTADVPGMFVVAGGLTSGGANPTMVRSAGLSTSITYNGVGDLTFTVATGGDLTNTLPIVTGLTGGTSKLTYDVVSVDATTCRVQIFSNGVAVDGAISVIFVSTT